MNDIKELIEQYDDFYHDLQVTRERIKRAFLIFDSYIDKQLEKAHIKKVALIKQKNL